MLRRTVEPSARTHPTVDGSFPLPLFYRDVFAPLKLPGEPPDQAGHYLRALRDLKIRLRREPSLTDLEPENVRRWQCLRELADLAALFGLIDPLPPDPPSALIAPPPDAITPDLLARFTALQQADQDQIQPIPEAEREHVRQTHTLQQFYERWMQAHRERAVAAGDIARGTLGKERSALRKWNRWDRTAAPADWPEDVAWPGLPIGFITGAYLDRFLSAMRADNYAKAYAESTWLHLRTVFNFAVRVKALAEAPKPKCPGGASETADDEFLFIPTYTNAELGRIYDALADWRDLQAALVLSCNAGPRTVDLFSLHWQTNVRLAGDEGEVVYRAVKTGKAHWVPLAPVTVAHLRRLTGGKLLCEGPLFPKLASHSAKDPERGRRARLRNDLFKRALEKAGVEVHEKPWQVLRATCNTRLNTHRPGAGKLLLHGPDAGDVNSRHYFDPTALLWDAVRTVPQPPEFLQVFNH